MKGLQGLPFCLVLWISLLSISVSAQEIEKAVLRLDLSYYKQENGQLPTLKATTKTKAGKRFEPVDEVEINIFLNEESTKGFLGRIKSSDKGTAYLKVPPEFGNELDTATMLKFIATVVDNKKFEDVSAEIDITRAQIELSLNEEDSIRTMRARVLVFEDGNWTPEARTDIKFVVKRLLSDLNAGEEELYTTDENGEASSEFTLNIPGDLNGDIVIAAKIEDNDLYGSVSSSHIAKWGTVLKPDHSFAKRTLWSTRGKAPIWLLTFANLIIAGVWGAIFYLMVRLFQIMRIGRSHKNA